MGERTRNLRYASVCSGIEGATLAWRGLGWESVFVSEIEPFPCSVLRHHYPDVPNRGDMTRYREWPDATFDVLVGGTPCQSFSVAGLRAGLADPRGNLALVFLGILDRYRPRWVVWENVPGVLSSWSDAEAGPDGSRWQTNDFDTFLRGLCELGYGVAWSVLDAQYFGVAQRRERVFVVGHLGDAARAAAVLFDRHCLSGHPAPRREARESVAGTLASRPSGGGRLGTDFECSGGVVPAPFTLAIRGRGDSSDLEYRQDGTANAILTPNGGRGGIGVGAVAFGGNDTRGPIDVATARNAHPSRLDFESETFVALAIDLAQVTNKDNRSQPSEINQRGDVVAIQAGALRENPDSGPDGVGVQSDIAYTLEARAEVQAVGFANTAGATNLGYGVEQAPPITQRNGDPGNVLVPGMMVRRLTPLECERLQGTPDGYTLVPHNGKPAADGPRYKALGNGFAVPVVSWIGQRIQMVEDYAPSAVSPSSQETT